MGAPQCSQERLDMVHYLLHTSYGRLYLHSILNHQRPRFVDGSAYARAWAVMWYLYHCQPEETAVIILGTGLRVPFPIGWFMPEEPSLGQFEKAVKEMVPKNQE